MMDKSGLCALERAGAKFREMVEMEGLLDLEVSVLAKPLTPEEAIGEPGRRDFPIIIGKERVLEAEFRGCKGHAFTDSPREFMGTLKQVLELPLESNRNRAVFIAVMNAAMRSLGLVHGTVHCKDDDPEMCAARIAELLLSRYGMVRVGLIGLNPAIAERLVETFCPDQVRISDLSGDNIGKYKFGVEIWDGGRRAGEVVDASDAVVLTGTTLVNATFDSIWERIREQGKHCLVYGVTFAAAAELLGIERVCPCGRDE